MTSSVEHIPSGSEPTLSERLDPEFRALWQAYCDEKEARADAEARLAGVTAAADDWEEVAHSRMARLAAFEALDDDICAALMAAKHGSYDGKPVERHLERLLDKFRAPRF